MILFFSYVKKIFSLSSSRPLTPAAPPNLSRRVLGDTIMFDSVQIGGSAVYQCNASNQHGYLLANAFVSILGETLSICLSVCLSVYMPLSMY